MTSTPKLYDLVIYRNGRLVESGLTMEDAKARARDWNSRAVAENWMAWEPHRPDRQQPTGQAENRGAGELPPEPAEASKPANYLPTLEQIREACLQIQATWSQGERMRRAGGWEGGAA